MHRQDSRRHRFADAQQTARNNGDEKKQEFPVPEK
jgi:hypothetical protein